MPRKPRIMLVGPWPPTQGGVTTFMLNVAGSQLSRSFDILPFTTSRPARDNLAPNYGYRAMFRGGLWRFAMNALITLGHVASFPIALLVSRPDAVQVQASDYQAFWEASCYVAICKAMRRPVLMRIGGSFDRFYEASSADVQRRIRQVIAWPALLIVQSQYWAEFVGRCGRSDAVVILPNSVPDELVEPIRREADPVPTCVFMAGTAPGWKGLDELLGAIDRLCAAGVSVRFRIIAASDALRKRVSNASLTNLVEAQGFLSRDGVVEAMRSADIFLLPSYGEGFPNSLLEAMAVGLAPIVTPVGAIPEIVGDAGAIKVPVRDADALAAAIERLAGDPLLRASIAAAARAIVRTRYTHSAVMPVLGEAWRSAIGQTQDRYRAAAG